MMKPTKDKLLASIFTNSPGLVSLWAKQADVVTNTSTPWAAAAEDILQGPIALVTTTGVHLIGQPPFDMDDPEGDASFREIPSSTPAEALTITHNYYDHRDADADINVVFPLERLKDLEGEGFIGGVARRHFSFMGHILQSRLGQLTRETAPAVASELKEGGVRAAFLTPS
jgi:D-proline reductase (dithiol) PrdB